MKPLPAATREAILALGRTTLLPARDIGQMLNVPMGTVSQLLWSAGLTAEVRELLHRAAEAPALNVYGTPGLLPHERDRAARALAPRRRRSHVPVEPPPEAGWMA